MALAMAFLVLSFQRKKISFSIVEELLNPKVWLHPSSYVDFQLLFLNSILKTLLFLFVSVSSIAVAKAVALSLANLSLPRLLVGFNQNSIYILYGLLSFIALDFSRFYQHYLFHKIPILWQFHKVHHSAEVLTPLTLYRTHPVESLIASFRRVFVIGVVSGLFVYMTQSAIGGLAILGVNAFDFVFNFLGSNLRHSHIWLSFGPLNHIFISPAQHQIHHSRSHRHHDKNFGIALAIWDKLFGSFENCGLKKQFLVFGIKGEKHRSLLQSLSAPNLTIENPLKTKKLKLKIR